MIRDHHIGVSFYYGYLHCTAQIEVVLLGVTYLRRLLFWICLCLVSPRVVMLATYACLFSDNMLECVPGKLCYAMLLIK